MPGVTCYAVILLHFSLLQAANAIACFFYRKSKKSTSQIIEVIAVSLDSAVKKAHSVSETNSGSTQRGSLAVDAGKQSFDNADNSPQTKTERRRQPNVVEKLARPTELYLAFGMVIFFIALYAAGHHYWDERYYIPEEGLGYFLGLVGGITMLLAMVYSAFKYLPSLRSKIKIKAWLNIHIALGLIGPLLIYFHSAFHIGSLNGGIALISMSLVLLSGIIGRYLYSKTHYGLGGRKAKLGELHKLLNDNNSHIHSPRLNRFTQNVMRHSTSLLQASWELVSYGIRSRWVYWRAKREMLRKLKELVTNGIVDRKEFRKNKRRLKKQLRTYLILLHKVALFKLYERFFAFWRHAHVPLLYLLLLSGIVHVIAVHMY